MLNWFFLAEDFTNNDVFQMIAIKEQHDGS